MNPTASSSDATIRQRFLHAAFALLLFAGLAAPAQSEDWNGYDLTKFNVEGRGALIVEFALKHTAAAK